MANYARDSRRNICLSASDHNPSDCPRPKRRRVWLFPEVRGNARVMVMMEPMWAIPYLFFYTYSTLYMRGLGLTEPEVGLTLSIASASSMIIGLIGAPIADRLGRKKTCTVFGIITWSIPTLIWALARDFRYFVVAGIINGFVGIVSPSYNCLLIEDTPPESRLSVFAALHLVSMLPGFFLPLSGVFVRNMGVVPATRMFYFAACIIMTAFFLIRNRYLTESHVGTQRIAATQGHGFKDSLIGYVEVIGKLFNNHAALVILIVNALMFLRDSIIASMQQIYIVENLRIDPVYVGIIPAVSATAQLLALLFILTRPRDDRTEARLLIVALSLLILGVLVFILTPEGCLGQVLISGVLTALGASLAGPTLSTALNNALADEDRVRVLSLSNVIQNLVRMGGTASSGFLYRSRPVIPFIVALGLSVTCLMIYCVYLRKHVSRGQVSA
jgi:DHA1 family tetracycline resistance protein-like MFS transporter